MMYYEELWKDLQGFLDYREASGYGTDNHKRLLTAFIHFCEYSFPNAGSVTKTMIDGFLSDRAECTTNTQAAYISILRAFMKYICFLGKSAYVPDDDYSLRREAYIPHIPDKEELLSFFRTVDGHSPDSPAFHAGIMLPVIFRMQYCCGMRPGEPLRLRKDDVSLTDGDIYICETKNNRDRHIVMSNDLLRLCRKYDGIALLPYLSAYMGHSKISSTFYYIHLLPQRLRESAGIEWDTLDEIYREGEHHEKI